MHLRAKLEPRMEPSACISRRNAMSRNSRLGARRLLGVWGFAAGFARGPDLIFRWPKVPHHYQGIPEKPAWRS
jgi:hypothetical protein